MPLSKVTWHHTSLVFRFSVKPRNFEHLFECICNYFLKLHGILIITLNYIQLYCYVVWYYPFTDITPSSTLIRNGSTCYNLINGSNRSIWKLLILDRNTWNYIIQWKQRINGSNRSIWKLLILDRNSWNYISQWKQRINDK